MSEKLCKTPSVAEFGDQAGKAGATGRGMNAVALSLLSGPTAMTELRQDSSQSLSRSTNTERETHRHRHTQRNRHTHNERATHTEMHRETHTQRERHTH